MIESKQEAFYIEWLNKRFTVIYDGIKEVFGENFLKNKTLLELGAFNGNFGHKFYEKGAIVTCYEARQESLNRLRELHPNFESHLKNMDVDKIEKKYDIILHAGLLYHLWNVKENLIDTINNCDVLILETENIDSDDLEINVQMTGPGNDIFSSYWRPRNGSTNDFSNNENNSDYVTRVSRRYLETFFKENNLNFKLLKDGRANHAPWSYDWSPVFNNNINGLRSIYLCWK